MTVEGRHPCLKLQPVLDWGHLCGKISRERCCAAVEVPACRCAKEKPEAEALWTHVRKELGDTPPPYFQAIVTACCAFFALNFDSLFLAPTMDILNVAHPVLQFLAAAGFAALCTICFGMVGLLYIGAKGS
jgi:hypothetical protein